MFDAKEWAAAQVAIVNRIRALPVQTMFTPAFMRKNTDFSNIDDFLDKFKEVSDEYNINEFTRDSTMFESWMDMFHTAYEEAFLQQG